MKRTVYLNGQYISENEAKISIFDRSVQFADSVYEVLSILDGKIVDFNGHLLRLDRSLNELNMKDAPSHDEWLVIFRKLISVNSLREGIIYLQITRGESDRDFHYPKSTNPLTVIAFTQEKNLIDHPKIDTGISVITVADERWGRCDIKTTQLLYASMMKMKARAQGADDAWMMRDNIITEGTSNNAAIITHDNELITHNISTAILAGTTRNIMLDLAGEQSLEVTQRAFTLDEALHAREAFVSAASLFVMPVTQINGNKVGDGCNGHATLMLRQKYIEWACKTAI